MLLIGILSTIITILGYSVFSLIKEGNMTYLNFFFCDKDNYVCISNFYGKIIFYTLINTILQVLILLVVYYFSPEIFAISDIISPFFSFLTKCYLNKIKYRISIISTIIAYLIIIFISFIYNEILVCNFCGLNENTWKAIEKKAIQDYLDDDEDDQDKDSSELEGYEMERNSPKEEESLTPINI